MPVIKEKKKAFLRDFSFLIIKRKIKKPPKKAKGIKTPGNEREIKIPVMTERTIFFIMILLFVKAVKSIIIYFQYKNWRKINGQT